MRGKASVDDGFPLLHEGGAVEAGELEDLHDVLLLQPGTVGQGHAFRQTRQGHPRHGLQIRRK